MHAYMYDMTDLWRKNSDQEASKCRRVFFFLFNFPSRESEFIYQLENVGGYGHWPDLCLGHRIFFYSFYYGE